MTLRLSVVEDQARFRLALQTVIELTPDLSLGEMFPSVAALRSRLEAAPSVLASWDVVLLDLELPGESGLDALSLLKSLRPELPVVMCTVFDDRRSVDQAIRMGADGYLLKSASLPELLRRVREAAAGGAPLAPKVARTLLESLRAPAVPAVHLDGSALVLPSGTPVDLRRRGAVRRVLEKLASAKATGDAVVSSRELIEAGWPGDASRFESAQARLWTSIRVLRRLGLGDALETVGQGYRLRADVRVLQPETS